MPGLILPDERRWPSPHVWTPRVFAYPQRRCCCGGCTYTCILDPLSDPQEQCQAAKTVTVSLDYNGEDVNWVEWYGLPDRVGGEYNYFYMDGRCAWGGTISGCHDEIRVSKSGGQYFLEVWMRNQGFFFCSFTHWLNTYDEAPDVCRGSFVMQYSDYMDAAGYTAPEPATYVDLANIICTIKFNND